MQWENVPVQSLLHTGTFLDLSMAFPIFYFLLLFGGHDTFGRVTQPWCKQYFPLFGLLH